MNGVTWRVVAVIAAIMVPLTGAAFYAGTTGAKLADHIDRGAHPEAQDRIHALERVVDRHADALKRMEDKLDKIIEQTRR